MAKTEFIMSANNFNGGYIDQPRNAASNQLAPPSINVRINSAGEACTRFGFEDTGIDLSIGDKSCTGHFVSRFNVTFYAGGTKLVYMDHNDSDNVYDTGITLTDGTVTRMADYAGILFITNNTDGLQMLHMTKLNGAVTGGASTITIDLDGAAKLDRFGHTTDSLRIKGTDEAFNAVNTTTGALTLVGTASQGYSDNDFAVVHVDISSGKPKFSKIEFWGEAMYGIGASTQDADASSDVPPSVLYFSQFVTAATIENIIDFSGGLSGTELVGKAGIITNIIATNNFLYIFKQDSTCYIDLADVNKTSGARPPQPLQDANGNVAGHGCLNEDCAVHIGNGEIGFATQNKRNIRIKIATDSGAPVVFPDELWDYPIQNILTNMDDDQPNAHVFYDTTDRTYEFEAIFDGQRLTVIYQNVPIFNDGVLASTGRWLPPDIGKSSRSKHMRKGRQYATALDNDTIFLMNEGFVDDDLEIDCVMATGAREIGKEDGRVTVDWKAVEISGSMTELAEVTFEGAVGSNTPQQKSFDSTGLSYDTAVASGAVQIGDNELGGLVESSPFADFDKRFAIYPRFGPTLQIILSSFKTASAFKWYSYRVEAAALSKSLLTTK